MDVPFFTVIMPAHNSAKFIRKALDSIKAQSFTDYELIVVCDACTDNTAEIAREYTNKVIEVSYEADGLARNAALDIAQGEWILQIDSDDWFLHEYAFHMLAQTVGQKDEDVCLFSFIWKGRGYTKQTPQRHYYAIWNKAVRRSFLGDIRYPPKKYWSDVDFDKAIFTKNPVCQYYDQPLYYYNYMFEGSNSWLQREGIIE